MKLSWFKKKSFYIPAIIIVVIVLIFFYRSRASTPSFVTIMVKRENLSQEVTVSGTVKDKAAVLLAFEKSGRVRKVNADVGDKVAEGDVLLALENGVEFSAVLDAQAKLASKQAHYDDLKKGGRPEEISVKETELAKAKSDLSADYAAVPNIVLDAFNKADNAVHRQADTLFSNALSSNPQISFNSSDQQAVIDSQNGRYDAEATLNNFKKLTQNGNPSDSDNENSLAQAKNYLLSINNFITKINRALNTAINLSDSVLSTDKDALNTARTNLNTAITNVTDQIQAIATQKITVEMAASQLELTKVGATAEVLAGATADIASAEANVKNAQAVLAKTYITSPISGIVTREDAKAGEIAPANTALISVASGNFKVEAFIPEVDIAKVSVGNQASITLDAYGSNITFDAHVVKIDPAETVIDGVSTYKTTFEFNKSDERIRSGMTANTTIVTATSTNALSVPQRAVYEKNGRKFVQTIAGKTPTEREVTVGIKGANGNIEILSGLTENEIVLTSGQVK